MQYDGSTLTLIDVDPKTLFFSDRPDDIAGFLSYTDFIELVFEGPDSFKQDSPNASFMIFSDNSIEQAVVTITARPIIEGNTMIYPSLEIIEGQLPATGGANTLFIDVIGRPLTPTSIAGVHRRCIAARPDMATSCTLALGGRNFNHDGRAVKLRQASPLQSLESVYSFFAYEPGKPAVAIHFE